MELEQITVAGPLFAALATVFIFLAFLITVRRLAVWLWGRLPSKVLSIDIEQFNKIVGVLLSLIMVPNVASYGWLVINSLIAFFPEFIGNITSYQFPQNCSDKAEQCISRLSQSLTELIRTATVSIFRALHLQQFPVDSFIWFLLCALVATQIIGLAYRAIKDGSISH